MKLDVNEVLDLYESVLKRCPECDRTMMWFDYSDHCPDCNLTIHRDYDTSKQTVNQDE